MQNNKYMSTGESRQRPAHLASLAALEALAQQGTRVIHQHLQPGMSERDAANLLRDWLKQHGIEEMAHRPLAWFGEHTALRGADRLAPVGGRPLWFPGERILEPGMAVALYCAPQRDGLIAEASLCAATGADTPYQALCNDVEHLRRDLLAALDNGMTLSAVPEWLSITGEALGLEPRHDTAPLTGAMRRYSGAVTTQRQRSLLFQRLRVNELQLPAAASASQPVDDSEPGLWVIQPWLVRDRLGAGFKALVYWDGQHSHWLNRGPRTPLTDTPS